MKETNMLKLDFSSREGEATLSEGVSTLPHQTCGRLKDNNNEESL